MSKNVTMTLNEEKQGVELAFAEKPEKATLKQLKELGYHWHNQRQIWFAKQTEERIEFAQSLCGITPKKSKKKSDPAPKSAPKAESKPEMKPTSYEELLDMLNQLDVKAAKEAIEANIELLKQYKASK